MKIKRFIFNNFGLKITALFLALFVWILISGKERSYLERTMDINVQYYNISENLDVTNVRPDKVRMTVRATTKELETITAQDFKINIDLKDITEPNRLIYFAEDHLQLPEEMQISDLNPRIHPKMIEITVKELIIREVKVRVRYKGKFKRGIVLIDRRVIPERVKIFGYKSQISDIVEVEAAESINLAEIEQSRTFKISLKKGEEILRFEDTDEVEVFVEVENRNKPKKDEQEKTG
jgi:YbbR domain-containing protein